MRKRTELKCPKCNSRLEKRKGKFGEFWGCHNFPKCDFTSSIVLKDEFDISKIVKEKYDFEVSPKLARLFLKQQREGIVYFIRLKENNLIKIGSTIDYLGRLKSLNSEHRGIVPILLLKTKFYQTFEKFFHDLFNDFLKDRSEYFEIPEEYLIEVVNIKSFLGEKIQILKKEKIGLAELLEKISLK